VLGDPGYYKKFGFSVEAAKVFDCVYAGPHFQALELRGRPLQRERWKLIYPPAFAGV
jgi:putative acetyltransferase